MDVTLWPSTQSDCQRCEYNDQEQKDLDQRGNVFKPGEPDGGEKGDDRRQEKEDCD